MDGKMNLFIWDDIPKDEEGKTWKFQKKTSKIMEDIEKDCWNEVK